MNASNVKRSLICRASAGIIAGGLLFGVNPARAVSTVTESAGTGLSATASFTVSGSMLTVVLSNGGADVMVPTNVLTGVFFSLPTGVTLAPLTAVLSPGSTVLFDTAPAGGVVGGEFAYGSGFAAPGGPGGLTNGISTAGLGLFGSANFSGPDLDGPDAVAGLNYGLTSASDNPATGNAPVTGGFPLIQSSVTFTLGITGGLPESFFTGSTVNFQYGTSLDEPHTNGTPGNTPGVPDSGTTVILSGLALIALALGSRQFAGA